MDKYFFHDIRGKDSTVTRKGIEVKDTLDAAKQAYHAYLGAYAYEHDANTDYVSVFITDSYGIVVQSEVWPSYIPEARPEPEPEPTGNE